MIQLKPAHRPEVSVPESSDMQGDFTRHQIVREAKAIVALAFRNGPIEQVHAGQPCPTCAGRAGISRITDDEMKAIMQNAVDRVYALLALKTEDPAEYERQIRFGERYTAKWDDPKIPTRRRPGTEPRRQSD